MNFNSENLNPEEVIGLVKSHTSSKQIKQDCENLRKDIIEVCAKNGGHLSSNLGVVELTYSLIQSFDPLKDDILFDVGHQSYVYKLLTGRDISSIRQKDGIRSFQYLAESQYDKMEAGHSSTALSVGYGFSCSKFLKKDDSYTVCVVGDSSVANGLSFEALNQIATDNNKRLIIVINDNGMSICNATGAVNNKWSKLRNSNFYLRNSEIFRKLFSKSCLTRWFYNLCKNMKDGFKATVLRNNILESIGLKYFGPIDGHNVFELNRIFNKAKQLKCPVVIHVITKKGKGYTLAENDKVGEWHGVSPFNIETGEINLSNDKTLSTTTLVSNLLYSYMKKDKNCVLINPAMVTGTKMNKIFNDFPERTYDVGISEEHAVTFASGFGLKKINAIVSIYSTFMQRSYDEILHDISRMKLNTLFLVERCGLVGQDGETHQGIFDVAFLNTMPNVNIVMPYSLKTFEDCLSGRFFDLNKPTFVRISRDSFTAEDLTDYKRFDKYDKINEKHNDSLVIGVGIKGFKLLEKIDENKYDKVMLCNLLPTYKEIKEIVPNIEQYNNIIIIDKYSTYEGSASHLEKLLIDNGIEVNFDYFVVKKDFISQGTIDQQLKEINLDDEYILSLL